MSESLSPEDGDILSFAAFQTTNDGLGSETPMPSGGTPIIENVILETHRKGWGRMKNFEQARQKSAIDAAKAAYRKPPSPPLKRVERE